MGLDMATVGASLIERVVRERMTRWKSTTTASTWRAAVLGRGVAGPDRTGGGAGDLVLPRPRSHAGGRRLARERLAAQPARPVRILSLPCSTGEEPYSLAMALLDAGMMPAQFVIDAYDIRTRSLEIAAAGIYGRNSFRGATWASATAFPAHDGGWQCRAIREQVRFAPGNLLAPDFLRHAAPYDFIFCRNVLIYFERDVQHRSCTCWRPAWPDAVSSSVRPRAASC
jgi:chemotaxis protein methyltransferase WspC